MPVSEFEMRRDGTWDEAAQAEVDTVCPYCGVGCNLTLHVQDDEIVKVTSPDDHDVTRGNLCIKGRFGYQHVQNRHDGALPDPLLAGRPSLVKAFADDGTPVSRQLDQWFQQEIDRRAMAQGLLESGAYLEAWSWGDQEERDGTADEVLDAVEHELEAEHT